MDKQVTSSNTSCCLIISCSTNANWNCATHPKLPDTRLHVWCHTACLRPQVPHVWSHISCLGHTTCLKLHHMSEVTPYVWSHTRCLKSRLMSEATPHVWSHASCLKPRLMSEATPHVWSHASCLKPHHMCEATPHVWSHASCLKPRLMSEATPHVWSHASCLKPRLMSDATPHVWALYLMYLITKPVASCWPGLEAKPHTSEPVVSGCVLVGRLRLVSRP